VTDFIWNRIGPDHYTENGAPVWADITGEHVPCDLADVPIRRPAEYAQVTCHGTAERRYGPYNACGPHSERAAAWADQQAWGDRCEEREAARFEEWAY
jgi:hypothetical protein